MSDLDIEIGAGTLPEAPAPEAAPPAVRNPAGHTAPDTIGAPGAPGSALTTEASFQEALHEVSQAPETYAASAGGLERDRARLPETLAVKLAATGAGTLIVALATVARLWYVPFLVGLALGALGVRRGRRARSSAFCAALAGLAGWAAPLVVRSLEGQPVLATARVAAALAGLPPTGWIIVVAGLLVAVVQALLGTWLARSAGALGTAFTTARSARRQRDVRR
jgi:hypothetical protein